MKFRKLSNFFVNENKNYKIIDYEFIVGNKIKVGNELINCVFK